MFPGLCEAVDIDGCRAFLWTETKLTETPFFLSFFQTAVFIVTFTSQLPVHNPDRTVGGGAQVSQCQVSVCFCGLALVVLVVLLLI